MLLRDKICLHKEKGVPLGLVAARLFLGLSMGFQIFLQNF